MGLPQLRKNQSKLCGNLRLWQAKTIVLLRQDTSKTNINAFYGF